MNFARQLPERAERAYAVRDIRLENLEDQNEKLRPTLVYLLDAVESKNRFDSDLEWKLALTVSCCIARKAL